MTIAGARQLGIDSEQEPSWQRLFVIHLNTARRTIRENVRIVEIAVVASYCIRAAAFGGLHYMEIFRIAERRMVRMIENYAVRFVP